MNEIIDLLTFREFPKMARLNRDVVVTEKIDGTNAQVYIVSLKDIPPGTNLLPAVFCNGEFAVFAGSRTRWISPGKTTDNAGFARWVVDNVEELLKLGPGQHFGEFWGRSIQRTYGLEEKRFSLFNVGRWMSVDKFGQLPGVLEYKALPGDPLGRGTTHPGPACCHVVPTLWRGNFKDCNQHRSMEMLAAHGSFAAPGFMKPEGIVVYHEAAKKCFKVTIENDESPKSALTNS